jgi:hypothetical protein
MKEVEEFIKAIARIASIPMNYAGYVLSKLGDNPELTVLKFHTTAVGDRMVLRLKDDPNWLYEVEIRAWKPEELESESSTFMFPKKSEPVTNQVTA